MHLTLFSQTDLLDIHNASLRVLAETGILIDDPEGRSLLFDHGAEENNGRLCLPPELVEQSLAQCPLTVTLRGRGVDVTLAQHEVPPLSDEQINALDAIMRNAYARE